MGWWEVTTACTGAESHGQRVGAWYHITEHMGAQPVQLPLAGEAAALGNSLCPQH